MPEPETHEKHVSESYFVFSLQAGKIPHSTKTFINMLCFHAYLLSEWHVWTKFHHQLFLKNAQAQKLQVLLW